MPLRWKRRSRHCLRPHPQMSSPLEAPRYHAPAKENDPAYVLADHLRIATHVQPLGTAPRHSRRSPRCGAKNKNKERAGPQPSQAFQNLSRALTPAACPPGRPSMFTGPCPGSRRCPGPPRRRGIGVAASLAEHAHVVGRPGSKPNGDVTIDYVGPLENAALVISRVHRGEKRLVFCDSRARVELLPPACVTRRADVCLSQLPERCRPEAGGRSISARL
jgi:hypothetical protein